MSSLEEVIFTWMHPTNIPPPHFPIIYLECRNAFECRGFLEIKQVAGDVDFSGYPLRGEDVIIDSLGRMFGLSFERFVFPNKLIGQLIIDDIFCELGNVIKLEKDQNFIKDIKDAKAISDLVKLVADHYTW